MPFYESSQYQNARKWWTYGRVYPLFTPAGFVLPFQVITEHVANSVVQILYLFDANNDTTPVADLGPTMRPMITKKEFATLGYDVFVFPACCLLSIRWPTVGITYVCKSGAAVRR